MQSDDLTPVAAHLLASYSDVGDYSRQFQDDHETPPSLMAKVHHLRSIVQARLTQDARFELAAPFSEYGRVEFGELASGERFLLRSAGALAVEKAKKAEPIALFAFAKLIKTSDVQLLIYEFVRHGLVLSIAPTVHRVGSRRLYARGEPVRLGFWPYSATDDQAIPFDQAGADLFDDVGDLDDGGESGGVV